MGVLEGLYRDNGKNITYLPRVTMYHLGQEDYTVDSSMPTVQVLGPFK